MVQVAAGGHLVELVDLARSVAAGHLEEVLRQLDDLVPGVGAQDRVAANDFLGLGEGASVTCICPGSRLNPDPFVPP